MRLLTAPATRRTVLTLLGLVVVLAAWQATATIWFSLPSGRPGAVPAPVVVLGRIGRDLVDPAYWNGIGATVGSALGGFAIGGGVALVLGGLVVLVPALETFATQIGLIAACAPSAAIAPMIALLSPVGSRAVSVALAAIAVAFPTIIGVLLGLRSANPAQVDLVRAYGGGELTVIRRVRSIAALPAVFSALKIAAPSAFLGAIVGEFFEVGVDTGAGRLLLSLQYVGDYAGMWAVAVLSTLVSALGYGLVAGAERALAPWTRHGLR